MRRTLLVLLTLWLVDAPAAARSRSGGPYLFPTYPRDTSEGVPVTTHIWLEMPDFACLSDQDQTPYLMTMFDPTGRAVPGRNSFLAEAHEERRRCIRIFSPHEPLQPSTQYRVEADGRERTTFRTTATSAQPEEVRLPQIRNLQSFAVESDSACSPSWGAWFDFDVLPAFTLVEFAGTRSKFDPQTLSGTVDAFFLGEVPQFRQSTCGGRWPELKLGTTLRFRYAALEFSGAFSGWSDWIEITIPVEATRESRPAPPPPAEPPTWFEILTDRQFWRGLLPSLAFAAAVLAATFALLGWRRRVRARRG